MTVPPAQNRPRPLPSHPAVRLALAGSLAYGLLRRSRAARLALRCGIAARLPSSGFRLLPRIAPARIAARLGALSLAAALGLTAAPTRAADATLGRDQAAVAVSGAERWTLRPTRVTPAAALFQRTARTIPLSDLPTERRRVRVVYQGYAESRGDDGAGAPSPAR